MSHAPPSSPPSPAVGSAGREQWEWDRLQAKMKLLRWALRRIKKECIGLNGSEEIYHVAYEALAGRKATSTPPPSPGARD